MTIRYTHACSGSGRFAGMISPPSKHDPRVHVPLGWDSEQPVENCPACGDDAPVRGAYRVVELN